MIAGMRTRRKGVIVASINGISLRSIKSTKDHDGITIYNAAVYVDGKRSGTWAQSYYSNNDQYEPEGLYGTIKERAGRFAQGFPKGSWQAPVAGEPDVFMGALRELAYDEKIYKKIASSGYPTVVFVQDRTHYSAEGYTESLEEVKTNPDILEKLTDGFSKSKLRVYCHDSLKSFDVTVDKEHPVPERFIKVM